MKKAVGVLLSLMLAGCGFHLRAPLSLPQDIGAVRVVSPDPYSPLAQSLADAMARAGVKGATTGDDKAATLELISERWGETPIALDQLGRAQEFSLRYATIFALRGADGVDVVPQHTIELSRDFLAPATDAIGRASERELLAKELRRDMVQAILRYLDAASHKTGGVPPTQP